MAPGTLPLRGKVSVREKRIAAAAITVAQAMVDRPGSPSITV